MPYPDLHFELGAGSWKQIYADPCGSIITRPPPPSRVLSLHLDISEVVVVEDDLDAFHFLDSQFGGLFGHRPQDL